MVDQYIRAYSEGVDLRFSRHVSSRIFDVSIDVDVFEHNSQSSHREKAHVLFKRDGLMYECELCDSHDYESDFYPIVLDRRRFLGFRKTLYGFTLLDAETLTVEWEYFPEQVLVGEESFIITDVKQMSSLLIFEGCYWACPDECVAFDPARGLFLSLSRLCGISSLEETEVKDGALMLRGEDSDGVPKQVTLSAEDLSAHIRHHGQKRL